ncbi:MAG: hypothetical protein PVH88_06470 [Ignavibacteria bacterium]
MSWLVVLTYELYNAEIQDYELVNKNLVKIGLINEIVSPGGVKSQLPLRTFAAQFSKDINNTSQDIVDYIEEKALTVLREYNLEGKIFVSVGDNWSWSESVI